MTSDSAAQGADQEQIIATTERSQIVVVARDLGFSARQIVTREFRAERRDGRIVRVITD